MIQATSIREFMRGVTMAKIKLTNLDFHFDGYDKMIFKNLNLEIDTKWKTAIIARNGRGKTTLLNLIAGNLEPSKGMLIKETDTILFPLNIKDKDEVVLDIMKQYIGPYLEYEQIMDAFLKEEVTEA